MNKVYIMLNKKMGWKVVKDDNRLIDCTRPLKTLNTLTEAKQFCTNNNLEIIRVCQ